MEISKVELDSKKIVSDWQGRKVVDTILDSQWNGNDLSEEEVPDDSSKNAAMELSGLWSASEHDISVEDTVRNMRKGRRFDI